MARKGQVSIQDTVETDEEFHEYLEANADKLICMEVYAEYCGFCQATGNAIRKGKLEIGQEKIAMVKACSDNITPLIRFKYKSEPVFLFILKGKLTRVMFGANGIELCRIIEEELGYMQREIATGISRNKYDITEILPEEALKYEHDLEADKEHIEAAERLKVLTYAARKKRVCERRAARTKTLNFILFWPHCHQAHLDLYEKLDGLGIQVGSKITVQITDKSAKEVLYMSDIDPNEACLHALMNGEALVVLYKIFDTDNRDFVQLLRYVLYEEIPVPKEDQPPEEQLPPIPAFERYATISKTAREVRRDRYNAKMEKIRQEKEERERLENERARLKREAEEEEARLEEQRKEDERKARMAAGLPPEPEPEPEAEEEEIMEGEETEEGAEAAAETVEGNEATQTELEEEKVEEEEVEPEFHSDVEEEGEEYIPPGGLFVPGLYAPPNELAKANALGLFFPKIVSELCPLESEDLPAHFLVMFSVDKRHEVEKIYKEYQNEILAMGFFVGDDPYTMEHVAYSFKQYEAMERQRKHKDRLALMVSRRRSLALLQLAGLNPCFISANNESGERDCLQLFPVGYGDDFQDEESIVEEEEVVDIIQAAEGEEEQAKVEDERV